MAVKIRLARGGRKKRPYYSIVAANSDSPRDGRFLEKLGTYQPLRAKDDPERIVIDEDKAKAWLAKGAKPTDRVQRFLADRGLIDEPKRQMGTGKRAEEIAKKKAEAEAKAAG